METRILPLLSDGLRAIVINIKEKHEFCEIANQLLKADDLITGYNTYMNYFQESKEASTMSKVLLSEINSIITDECRMLSFRHNAFEISFLPKGKEAVYADRGIWSRENRQTAKPARIIQKLLVQEFKCKEFEDFSNWIKNEMMNSGSFELVSGKDITKFYNEENYLENKGTLGNSCMRYANCSKFFKLYEDKAKMLICRKEDKILGRAIVWELPEGTFMDRVYVCYDYLESQFIDYAEINKWHHREDNSLLSDGDYQRWKSPTDNYKSLHEYDLTIHLEDRYNYIPYVDSFRYYDEVNNTINTNPNKGCFRLSNTDGSFDEGDTYVCGCCEDSAIGYDDECPEGWVYSDYEDCYICPDCQVYCNGLDDYIFRSREISQAIVGNNIVEIYPLDYLIEEEDFIKINNNWYHKDCDQVYYDSENDKYKLNEE